jgi:hypothetical protein
MKTMKTSTTFACGIPENTYDLNRLLNAFVEKEKKFQKNYGLHKVFSPSLNENVGVAGLIRCPNQLKEYSNVIVEVAIFLKSKFIGKNIGFIVDGMLSKKGEGLNSIMIASIWEGNKSSIRLTEKYGGIFVGQTKKTYQERTVNANMYIKTPEGMPDVSKNINIENLLISKKIT